MKNFIKPSLILFLLIFVFSCSKDSSEQTEPNSGVQIEPNLNSGDNVEGVLTTHSTSLVKLNEFLNDNELDKALEQLKDWLESSPNIVSALVGNDDVEIHYTSGLTSLILISQLNEDGSRTKGGVISPSIDSSLTSWAIKEQKSISNNIESSFYGGDNIIRDKDVFIFDAFENEWGDSESTNVINILNASDLGFEINHLKNAQCTVNELKSITDYGLVYFSTHGRKGKVIVTREPVDLISEEIYREELYDDETMEIISLFEYSLGTYVETWGDYYGVTDKFIAQLNGTFPNSVIFNSSCQSTMSESLEQSFFNKGAKVYLGYNETTWTPFTTLTAYNYLYKFIIDELTASEAYLELPETQLTDSKKPNAKFELKIKAGNYDMTYKDEIKFNYEGDWYAFNWSANSNPYSEYLVTFDADGESTSVQKSDTRGGTTSYYPIEVTYSLIYNPEYQTLYFRNNYWNQGWIFQVDNIDDNVFNHVYTPGDVDFAELHRLN